MSPTSDQILNFARVVQPVYARLKWGWAHGGALGAVEVPSVREIEGCVASLIQDVEGGADSVSRGGLFAERAFDDEGKGCINFGMVIHG